MSADLLEAVGSNVLGGKGRMSVQGCDWTGLAWTVPVFLFLFL